MKISDMIKEKLNLYDTKEVVMGKHKFNETQRMARYRNLMQSSLSDFQMNLQKVLTDRTLKKEEKFVIVKSSLSFMAQLLQHIEMSFENSGLNDEMVKLAEKNKRKSKKKKKSEKDPDFPYYIG